MVVVSASLDVYLRPWCQQHNLEHAVQRSGISKRGSDRKVSGETAAAPPKRRVSRRTTPRPDYEEIFAYGDTPEDFAMLALATTKIYRWDEVPPWLQRQATQVKMARDCPSHRGRREEMMLP